MFPQTFRKAMKLCRSRAVITASIVTLLLLYYIWRAHDLKTAPLPSILHAQVACPESPLLNDVLVVIRTGATEVLEKLPVHFQTVLTCVPDYIIYSDFEEDIEGHHIFDVLDRIHDAIRMTVPELWLYNKLRASGREGLEYQTSFGSGPGGALDNPGWKLDKWKFLPMVDRALQYKPDAKWFIFVEPDTYMIWQNMLMYLSEFDPSKPYYLGRHMYIGSVLFAHGGSGFMISNPAMKMVTSYWKEHQSWFDEYTAKEWAGDMILGKAMENVGITLFSASPHIQGDSLTSVDWTINKLDKPPWCYAPLTFHHMAKQEFHLLWQFEKEWLQYNKGTAILRFRDIFKSIIHPRLQPERTEWDNVSGGAEYSDEALAKLSDEDRAGLSPTERQAQVSFHHCRAACESKLSCIQFSHAPGKCFLSNELRLGHAVESQCLEYSHAAGKCIRTKGKGAPDAVPDKESFISSGWMMNRVLDASKQIDQACQSPEGNDWVT
ncbi:glycosyltransferase family 31 protein [Xylariaceae sp. AK1471]|nr:glycosyltransferase family 31 protein [Xylariaceae sp. AK1471]